MRYRIFLKQKKSKIAIKSLEKLEKLIVEDNFSLYIMLRFRPIKEKLTYLISFIEMQSILNDQSFIR